MRKTKAILLILAIIPFYAFVANNQKIEDKFKCIELSDSSRTMDAVAGDIDNDGDLDIIIANMFTNKGPGKTKILFNDGNGSFTYSEQELLSQTHGVALGDLDGDNDLDLAVTCNSSYDKGVRVFINNGKGYFTDSGQILGEKSGLNIQLADMDCDGDLDMFCDFYQQNNILYINDGKAGFSKFDKKISALKYSAKIVDVNNDSKPDWLIKMPERGYLIELNKGDMQFENHFEMIDIELSWGWMCCIDMNNDGFTDLLTKSSMDGVTLWLNDKSGKFTEKQKFGAKSRGSRIAAGDLNDDGFNDVVITNIFMQDEIYYNDGKDLVLDAPTLFGELEMTMLPLISDFNSDGKNDIFLSRAMKMINKNRVELPNQLYINLNKK